MPFILTDKPKYKRVLELLIDLTIKLNAMYFRVWSRVGLMKKIKCNKTGLNICFI